MLKYLYLIDADAMSAQVIKSLCNNITRKQDSVAYFAHNGTNNKAPYVLGRYKSKNIRELRCQNTKQSADLALTFVLGKHMYGTDSSLEQVVLVTNDKPLKSSVRWLCKSHRLDFRHTKNRGSVTV